MIVCMIHSSPMYTYTRMAMYLPRVCCVYHVFGVWTCMSIHQLVNRKVAGFWHLILSCLNFEMGFFPMINTVGTAWNHQSDCDFPLDRHQLLTKQLQGPLPFVAHVALPMSTVYITIHPLFGLKLLGFCPANDERRAAGRSTGPLPMPDLCRWRFDGISLALCATFTS